MNSIKLKARAKINLGLDVVRKREDGYHDVRMIMQTIGLYDKISLEKTKEEGIYVTTNLAYLPTNENNLVYKAAKLMIDTYNLPGGIKIDVSKFIPVAAGLAGGSSDAAATLYGINRMYGLKLSQQKLMELGVKIGADVPFCIMRGTALAEGIGEKLTGIKGMPVCPVVIAKPAISVSTKFVYENLHLDEKIVHPDIDGMVSDITKGDIHGICSRMGNVLETVTVKEYPVIEDIKQKMKEQGAINAMMSGSGPTVFGIFEDKAKAEECTRYLRSIDTTKQVYLTETC